MYILDYNRQISMIREMTQLRKDTEKWVVYYHHPTTNEMWKSYFPKANGERRGPKILRIEPVPEKLAKRVDQCLQSSSKEDAMGLGLELSAQPDRWQDVLDIVEKKYKTYKRKQLKLFFQSLGVLNYKALFDELGKPPETYNLTNETLDTLARRAKKVRFKRFWVLG